MALGVFVGGVLLAIVALYMKRYVWYSIRLLGLIQLFLQKRLGYVVSSILNTFISKYNWSSVTWVLYYLLLFLKKEFIIENSLKIWILISPIAVHHNFYNA